MGVQRLKDDFDSNLQSKIIEHLVAVVSSQYTYFNLNDVNFALRHLTGMGYEWKTNEKLYSSLMSTIEKRYQGNIQKEDEEALPRLIVQLGEGNVNWKDLKLEVKTSLMHHMEAYIRRSAPKTKEMNNLIFG